MQQFTCVGQPPLLVWWIKLFGRSGFETNRLSIVKGALPVSGAHVFIVLAPILKNATRNVGVVSRQ